MESGPLKDGFAVPLIEARDPKVKPVGPGPEAPPK